MVTAIPPLTDAEKLEFGTHSNNQPAESERSTLVVASYNIRYARGPYLIPGGIARKLGLMSLAKRPQHIGNLISVAAGAFTTENCSRGRRTRLQEADKRTVRTGGHHVACELASQLNMNWVHAPAGIPRGIKPVKRQWWLDLKSRSICTMKATRVSRC